MPCRSYCARSPRDALGSAQVEKKHKYLQTYQDRRATFYSAMCSYLQMACLVLSLSFLLRDRVTSWLQGERDPIVW